MASSVDLLIFGAGWTAQFLIPLLDTENVKHAETTTTGRHSTIPFIFDPNSTNVEPYKNLPSARTILITFPLKGTGQSKLLTSLYRRVHGDANHWIQLGSSAIFNQESGWITEDSEYNRSDVRAVAEDELRHAVDGCILNLAGLYGGERKPSSWLDRIAKSKEEVRLKQAVHFVHGNDVARAIIAAHRNVTPKKRWIISDLRVYDWWDLILSFSGAVEGGKVSHEEAENRLQFANWVVELMDEEGVRALPRDLGELGRKLDSRGFWKHMGEWPKHARLA